MVTRVICSAVSIALTTLALTGCGRQVANDSTWDPNLLATSPEPGSLPVPRPWVAAALDATGGLSAWTQCEKLTLPAVATAYDQDGSFYLTPQQFTIYPWSNALRVTAQEPGARFTWQVVCGRYEMPQGDRELDVCPLSGHYRDYAEAVLQIVTAPARMLDDNVVLTRRPGPVQIGGQWYYTIEAKHQPAETSGDGAGDRTATVEPCWTQGIYFQSRDRSLVDMIWLGNPATQKYLVVRGYDYALCAGVLIPTQIEVFESDPRASLGPRLALVDLKQ